MTHFISKRTFKDKKLLITLLIIVVCLSGISLAMDIYSNSLTKSSLIVHIVITAILMILVSVIVIFIQSMFRRILNLFTVNLFSSPKKLRSSHDSGYSYKKTKRFTKYDFERDDFDPRYLEPNDIDDYVDYMIKKHNVQSDGSVKTVVNGREIKYDEFRDLVLKSMGVMDDLTNEMKKSRKKANKKPRSLRCENCGAPLASGLKKCPYCDSSIVY